MYVSVVLRDIIGTKQRPGHVSSVQMDLPPRPIQLHPGLCVLNVSLIILTKCVDTVKPAFKITSI